MNTRHCINALGRFLHRGSERKRLRQLSLACCLAPHYAAALHAREARHPSHPTHETR